MSNVDAQGPVPIGPTEKKLYEQEYRRGAKLFADAVTQYGKSENMYQKDAFKDVMDQAMRVLNNSARALMRRELLKQNEQIAKDYDIFRHQPSNPVVQQQLIEDLDKAKDSLK